MDLTIGFSRAKSPWKIGSRLIQLSEKRNFSHCYFKYTCPITNTDLVCQASLGMVNEMSYDIFKEENVIVEEYIVNINKYDYLLVMSFLKTNLGKKYSKLQIFVLIFMKMFSIKKELLIDGNKKHICSEFVAKGLKLITNITGTLPKELDTYSPSDLREFIWTEYNKSLFNIKRVENNGK